VEDLPTKHLNLTIQSLLLPTLSPISSDIREKKGEDGAGAIHNKAETPIPPKVSTFPYPNGNRSFGSRREKVIVLNVRISLKISAAECAASANNEEECEIIPPTAFTTTKAKFTNLTSASLLAARRIQSNSSNSYTGIRSIL
jgi:hypothetical protein